MTCTAKEPTHQQGHGSCLRETVQRVWKTWDAGLLFKAAVQQATMPEWCTTVARRFRTATASNPTLVG